MREVKYWSMPILYLLCTIYTKWAQHGRKTPAWSFNCNENKQTNISLLITNGQEAHTNLIAQCVSKHAAHKCSFRQYLL